MASILKTKKSAIISQKSTCNPVGQNSFFLHAAYDIRESTKVPNTRLLNFIVCTFYLHFPGLSEASNVNVIHKPNSCDNDKCVLDLHTTITKRYSAINNNMLIA